MEIGMTIRRDFSPEAHGHHLLGVAYRWVGSALSPWTNGETLKQNLFELARDLCAYVLLEKVVCAEGSLTLMTSLQTVKTLLAQYLSLEREN